MGFLHTLQQGFALFFPWTADVSAPADVSGSSTKQMHENIFRDFLLTVGYKKVNNKLSRTNYLDLLVGHLL